VSVAGRDDALLEELAELERLPVYMTREEAWTFLRLSDRGLDKMIERGAIAARRIGRRTLVPRASIRAWVLREAGIDEPNGGGALVDASTIFRGQYPPMEGST
jgi:excisionase family DNA binding protein